MSKPALFVIGLIAGARPSSSDLGVRPTRDAADRPPLVSYPAGPPRIPMKEVTS